MYVGFATLRLVYLIYIFFFLFYRPTVALMEKDLGLVMDIATKSRVRTPLGTNAHQLYGQLSDHG